MTRTLADPAVRPPAADAGSPRPRLLPVLVAGVLLAAAVRAFLVEAYVVPSADLTPVLQPGDRVLVLKADTSPAAGDLVVVPAPAGSSAGNGSSGLGSGPTARVLGPVAEALGIRAEVDDEVASVGAVDGSLLTLSAPTVRPVPLDDVVGTVAFRFWPLDRVGPVQGLPG
jgi:hypothetical protein